jgi:hypothetical protein
MALWAFWMFVAATASVVLTFVGIILIGWTLYHTKRAATAAVDMVDEAKATTRAADETVKVTRDIGQAQVRAYLHITGIAFGVRSDRKIFVGVKIKNVGQSPAHYTHFVARVQFATKHSPGEIYTEPVEIGIVGTGQEYQRATNTADEENLIPSDILSTEDGVSFYTVTIGVFAADVFDNSIEEWVAFMTSQAPAAVPSMTYRGDWGVFPADWIGHERFISDIRDRAWSGKRLAEHKPKQRE